MIESSLYCFKFLKKNLALSKLRGKTVHNFTNNSIEFKQIKFSETSYKNSKCEFYLAVVIRDVSASNSVLRVLISTPIYLESRKKTFPE
jgi:hypothetical protein